MPGLPSKQALRDELVTLHVLDLEKLERAYRATREGATHEEAKPENDKDTRALEQSYLARGQALRIQELTAGLAEVRAMPLRSFGADAPAAMGALVVVVTEEGAEPSVLFLIPHGGGSRIALGEVQTITPRSPLGRAVLGKRTGDECEVVLGGKPRVLVVVDVK
jgi:transcription elongation GreA/GreB family factor